MLSRSWRRRDPRPPRLCSRRERSSVPPHPQHGPAAVLAVVPVDLVGVPCASEQFELALLARDGQDEERVDVPVACRQIAQADQVEHCDWQAALWWLFQPALSVVLGAVGLAIEDER